MTYPQLPDLFDPVAWWSTVDGTRTAIIDSATARRYSYREVDRDADRWHALLARQRVQVGDRVGILAQNRYDFIPMFFGCIRLGAILVPLNWRLSGVELARVLGDAEPDVVFCEDASRALLEESLAHVDGGAAPRVFDLDHDVPTMQRAVADEVAPRCPDRSQDDTTMLLYTSGSTGVPKGVMLPHRQLLWNAMATTIGWRLGADDIGPAATPFFHTGGWHVFTTTLLSRGGAIVLMGAFEPAAYLDVLDRYGVTVTFGVPTQFAMMRDCAGWGRSLPKLRWFFSGGAPCPQGTKDLVRAAGYGFREGYGLTECGPNCFATNEQTAFEKDGSTGWPIPFLQMRLRADDGSLAGTDDIGELELRGPQMFSGYFRSPDKTADVMTADGWLRTGDLASRDAEGVHRIRGRRKEMFISGGENVFPGEVEAVLLDCPGVIEAIVIGVPDVRWGEVGCALIVRRDAALDEGKVTSEARLRLAGYKVPKRVVFVDAIPRLGSGKIDRRAAAMLIAEC
ncbi:class I adenylate-forming enzyme family protein [Gemmatimonas sp.]|uniref:class I adenylate-forming enzyme family protein n=1 Tax=Gemmatimonas sp. TaxID=1962908 RepID=UPI0039839B72